MHVLHNAAAFLSASLQVFFLSQPCRNTAVQLCYAARHINTANAVLVVFDCASQAIFGLIFLKNKGPIGVRRMLADW